MLFGLVVVVRPEQQTVAVVIVEHHLTFVGDVWNKVLRKCRAVFLILFAGRNQQECTAD